MTTNYDVAILGGGLAGLTLARQLKMENENLQIVILEKLDHPVPEAAFKVGESSVEIGAHYFAEVLKLKQHIEQEQLPKFGLRFFFNPQGQECLSNGLEMGLSEFFPKPSYQLDRGRLENHLGELVAQQGVCFLDGAKVRKVDLNEDRATHRVHYQRENENQSLTAQWVVDASGRAGILKKKLDLAEEVDHKIQAAWFRVGARIQIDDFCENDEWLKVRGNVKQRWLSTNHLMGKGYWVWLIPLASGNTSIGIVTDPRIHPLSQYNNLEKALAWLQEHQPQTAKAILAHDNKIMDFKALKNVAYGCKQVFSANRWALTGEAGVFLDPFYSPGSDFIAMSNSFITQLILRDISGKPIGSQTNIYEQLYFSLFRGTLDIYTNQYLLFGNMQIMPLKILWDYAVYWAHSAFLFIHQRLWDLSIFIHLRAPLQRITELNRSMQHFFNDWNDKVNATLEDSFLDQAQVRFMYDLNNGLMGTLDREAFVKQYLENVQQLELFGQEIREKIMGISCEKDPLSASHPKEMDLPEAPLFLENILPVLRL